MDAAAVSRQLDVMGFGRWGNRGANNRGWLYGESVRRYQWAFCGTHRDGWLVADGIAGPLTQLALEFWGTKLSEHFDAREFMDRREGIGFVRREVVAGLERVRGLTGGPLVIVSGFRTPQTNKRVGGASLSQHLHGMAVDIAQRPRVTDVQRMQLFSGIGANKNGQVVHLDMRHLDPSTNPTRGATPQLPARWTY